MKTLKVLDSENYESDWQTFTREAMRAIIIDESGRLALVESLRDGYYKFPGGGIERGESHADALIRETLEETGLSIIPESIRPFGMIHEKRGSTVREGEIFEQFSCYYTAEVSESVSAQKLDGYEAEAGYVLRWVDPRAAYERDMEIGKTTDAAYLLREAYVIGLIMEGNKASE